jgi:hypothetical protein
MTNNKNQMGIIDISLLAPLVENLPLAIALCQNLIPTTPMPF